jgi:hypothetical protein
VSDGFSHAKAIAWTLCVTLALSFSILASQRLFPQYASSLLLGGAIEGVLYAGAAAWLVRGGSAQEPLGTALGLRTERAPWMLLSAAALLGVVLHGPVDGLQSWMEIWAPSPPGELAERMRRLSPDSLSERLLLMGVAGLLAPFVEELFFRGALFKRLVASDSVSATVVTTSVCFTVSHAEPRIWPALGIVAVVLGVLRAWSVGIWPCFLLHATFNATTLAVAFSRPSSELVEPAPAFYSILVGSVLAGGVLFLIHRRLAGMRSRSG